MKNNYGDNKLKTGLEEIDNLLIRYVLDFLKTGEFKNKTANAYITSYRYLKLLTTLSLIHKLADDENDSSKALFDYYKSTIREYMK